MTELIDSNAYLGPWPFSVAAELRAPELARHLASAGIGEALVSPLAAVFCPDPMIGNAAMFTQLRHGRALHPVPVINPALATWQEHLAACVARGARAVRLFPNYHGYALTSPRLVPFMAAINAANVRLVVTVRLEDERQKYFALQIKGVPESQLIAFLRRFPTATVLCTGLYLAEAERIAKGCDNVCCELSFAESHATLMSLRQGLSADRILFGTGAPLLSAHAQAAKLRHPDIPARERHLVAAGNARRFFQL